jgi:putative MATE family efflux protein
MKMTDRRILRILVPAILENAVMTLSSMILMGYIGRLTVIEISVFGLHERIYGIYYALFKGLAIGVMVLLAASFAREDKAECDRILKTGVRCIFPAACVFLAAILLFSDRIFGLMTNDAVLISSACTYIRITAWLFPLTALISLNASAFQAQGNTRTPLVIAALGNLVNILCGYVLIFGWGPFAGLGIYGAAISRNISFVVMTAAGWYFLYGRHGLLEHYKKQKAVFRKQTVCDLLKAGIPASIENSTWQFASVFISRVILSYGRDVYAAYQFGLQAEGFCDMMSAGFLTAAMALSAQAIGAGSEVMYRTCYKRLCRFGLIISGITALYLAFFSRLTLQMLTDKEELIMIGMGYMHMMIICQIPQHMQKIVLGYLRTSGHEKTPMAVSIAGLWAVRLPLIIIAGTILHLDLLWLWFIMDLDQWIRYLLSVYLFRRNRTLQYVQMKEAHL